MKQRFSWVLGCSSVCIEAPVAVLCPNTVQQRSTAFYTIHVYAQQTQKTLHCRDETSQKRSVLLCSVSQQALNAARAEPDAGETNCELRDANFCEPASCSARETICSVVKRNAHERNGRERCNAAEQCSHPLTMSHALVQPNAYRQLTSTPSKGERNPQHHAPHDSEDGRTAGGRSDERAISRATPNERNPKSFPHVAKAKSSVPGHRQVLSTTRWTEVATDWTGPHTTKTQRENLKTFCTCLQTLIDNTTSWQLPASIYCGH